MSALESGVVIGGDYRIVEPLSEGGMGAVYVAEQISTGRRRALKAMKPELVKDARSRRRFVDEARVGARVESAHVVEVMGAGVDDATGIPWLAMELLDGVDLEQLVQRDGPLPLAQVAGLYEQLAHALGRAHERGIIHRDLKPENLFLAASTHYGGEAFLKILDFGIASFVASDKTAATVTSAIGSPLWIAPEQASPGAKLKTNTDVWAMGLIAFYLVTGKSYWLAVNAEPFSLAVLLGEILAHPLVPASERAAALGVTVPDGFDEWFGRCVVRDPEARFDEAVAAASALQVVALGVPAQAQRTAPSGVPATVALPPESLPGVAIGPRDERPPVANLSAPGWTADLESPSTGSDGGMTRRKLVLGAVGFGAVALAALGLIAILHSENTGSSHEVAVISAPTTEPTLDAMELPTADEAERGSIQILTDVVGGNLFVNDEDRGPLADGMVLPLPPGAYRFEARNGESMVAEQTLALEAGARVTLELSTPSAEPGSGEESAIEAAERPAARPVPTTRRARASRSGSRLPSNPF